MEDVLLEPVELTEAELDEVAGGGCQQECQPCQPCGCGIGVSLEVGLAVCL
jgi:hypothetical protein